MNSLGEYLIVKYEMGHMRNVSLGGIVIEISRECNTDLKDGNPQKCVIIAVSKDEKWLKPGDVVWTHYLGSDPCNSFKDGEESYHKIVRSNVFFKINDDESLEMNDNVYLAQQIIEEAEKTSSGIYISSTGDKPKALVLDITHKPSNTDEIQVGDRIFTQDDFQYIINYNNKKMVKIEYNFIAGIYG